MLKKVFTSFIFMIFSFATLAAQKTITVTSTVNYVYEPFPGSLPAPLNIGDQIVLSYTFDDATLPSFENETIHEYQFNENQAKIELTWSTISIKTNPANSVISHRVETLSNNGVVMYDLHSPGYFLVNGAPDENILDIGVYLGNDGISQSQTYTPWLTPDLNYYQVKRLTLGGSNFWVDSEITSITGPGSEETIVVWPADGKMHPSQNFDLFVSAPAEFNLIEFFTSSSMLPLNISCELRPSYYDESSINWICPQLNFSSLLLPRSPEDKNTIIRLTNPVTGETIERVMNWGVSE